MCAKVNPYGQFQLPDETITVAAILFGAIGLGFFTYGRRQRATVPFVVGITLLIFPYFVSNTWLLIVIGLALMALPYFISL